MNTVFTESVKDENTKGGSQVSYRGYNLFHNFRVNLNGNEDRVEWPFHSSDYVDNIKRFPLELDCLLYKSGYQLLSLEMHHQQLR